MELNLLFEWRMCDNIMIDPLCVLRWVVGSEERNNEDNGNRKDRSGGGGGGGFKYEENKGPLLMLGNVDMTEIYLLSFI